jgi:hypothetical protein
LSAIQSNDRNRAVDLDSNILEVHDSSSLYTYTMVGGDSRNGSRRSPLKQPRKQSFKPISIL